MVTRLHLLVLTTIVALGCHTPAATTPTQTVTPGEISVSAWRAYPKVVPLDVRLNGQPVPLSDILLFDESGEFALLAPGALGLGAELEFLASDADPVEARLEVSSGLFHWVIPLSGTTVAPPDCPPIGATCQSNSFNPASGACEISNVDDGQPCAPSTCTENAVCESGACVSEPVTQTFVCPSASASVAAQWIFEASSGESVIDAVIDAAGDVVALLCQAIPATIPCRLVALGTDGTPRWVTSLPHDFHAAGGSVQVVAMSGEIVVVPLRSTLSPILAYVAATGALLWSTDTTDLFPALNAPDAAEIAFGLLEGAAGNDLVGLVQGGELQIVFSLDVTSGQLLAQATLPGAFPYAPLGDGRGNLFDVTVSGEVPFSVALSEGGVEEWTAPPAATAAGLVFPVAVTDSALLLAGGTALDPDNGTALGDSAAESTAPVVDPAGFGYEVIQPDPTGCSSLMIRAFSVSSGTLWQCLTEAAYTPSPSPVLLAGGGVLAAIFAQDASTVVRAMGPDGTQIGGWTIIDTEIGASVGLIGALWITTGTKMNGQQTVVAAYALPGLAPATSGWIYPQGGFGHTYVTQ